LAELGGRLPVLLGRLLIIAGLKAQIGQLIQRRCFAQPVAGCPVMGQCFFYPALAGLGIALVAGDAGQRFQQPRRQVICRRLPPGE
jgi:hypothetical protein